LSSHTPLHASDDEEPCSSECLSSLRHLPDHDIIDFADLDTCTLEALIKTNLGKTVVGQYVYQVVPFSDKVRRFLVK